MIITLLIVKYALGANQQNLTALGVTIYVKVVFDLVKKQPDLI
jgi:hypothetical protein